MRVLVIDDDQMLRWVAQRALERSGVEVQVAASGAEGLRMAGAGEFDVVVCDMEMPGMTGLEVRERLPDHLRGRFLLWTGAPHLAEGSGARVLPKPSGGADLWDAVQEAYKG